MGANITVDGRTATVRGKTPLSSAAVMCSDLRASASLVLAAWSPRARQSSTASTTSTAATSASKKSCAA